MSAVNFKRSPFTCIILFDSNERLKPPLDITTLVCRFKIAVLFIYGSSLPDILKGNCNFKAVSNFPRVTHTAN